MVGRRRLNEFAEGCVIEVVGQLRWHIGFEMDGKCFRVAEATHDVLDESFRYRICYLPCSNWLLSMEPLAGETTPAAV